MAFVEFLQDFFHDGMTVQFRTPDAYIKTAAIFRYCGHFLVIQINDLSVFSDERSSFPLEIFRVDAGNCPFFLQFSIILNKCSNLSKDFTTFAGHNENDRSHISILQQRPTIFSGCCAFTCPNVGGCPSGISLISQNNIIFTGINCNRQSRFVLPFGAL